MVPEVKVLLEFLWVIVELRDALRVGGIRGCQAEEFVLAEQV